MTNQVSAKEAVHGLSCPRCGGIVAIPEGQIIVICPYCDQRSVVAATRPVTAPTQPAIPPPAAVPPSTTPLPPGTTVPGAPANPSAQALEEALAKSLSQGSQADRREAAGAFKDAFIGMMKTANQGQQDIQEVDLGDTGIGVRRYQSPLKINRDQAVIAFKRFLSGKFQVARDAASKAEISEVFLVHLPFWGVWGRGAAYAFGQEEVGSGDNKHYEAREKRVVREMSWNCPACEVGEFGVRQIRLDAERGTLGLEPFNADALHRSGMVFEPVGAEQTALEAARSSFEEDIKGEIKLDRTSQLFTRLLRPRMGLVYYPLWVVRYLYRGRSFQVVVDGSNGEVLYGKAPGSVGYRAAVLVGGMAAGSIVAIDLPALILSASSSSHSSNSSDNSFIFALIIFVAGLALMYGAYHTYRYGEHYEYHRFGAPKGGMTSPLNLPGNLRKAENVINVLEKFS